MLAGLFRGAIAELVDEALTTALALAGQPRAAGDVAVVGDVALGLALRKRAAASEARPASVSSASTSASTSASGAAAFAIVAEPGARAARKLEGVLQGSPAQLPLPDGALAAVIGVGALAPERSVALHQLIREWVRVVRDGGAVVLVDRVPRTLSTRHALCAGLTEIEQRASGRAVVTSGLVSRLVRRD
jgi:SAM-dependent methyltransferase